MRKNNSSRVGQSAVSRDAAPVWACAISPVVGLIINSGSRVMNVSQKM